MAFLLGLCGTAGIRGAATFRSPCVVASGVSYASASVRHNIHRGNSTKSGSGVPTGETAHAETKFQRQTIGLGPAAQGMTMEEWSRKKNSNVGPPVSDKLGDAWTADSEVRVRIEKVPGMPSFMPILLVRGLLTKAECEGLIAAVPTSGEGLMRKGEVNQLYNDRLVNYRYLTHDRVLAERMMARLEPYIPKEVDGGRLHGLNPAFRFVHHDSGGHQTGHIDGREPVEPAYCERAGGWLQSRLTLQIYLNEGFVGGAFAFLEPNQDGSSGGERAKYVHQPHVGDALIFYQERLIPPSSSPPYECLHEARDVVSGDKYACRTMVDYLFPGYETAKLSNLKDDMQSHRL
eukprot:TRINITY_DN12247_c0_g1_i1.p1 TRINITY_DN12247_c0_g1~~TRINITY_DN12247_c0_g1_i1.p1  ORF type:complete len:347 (-),score=38.53 TRINITY_DN12247_c0_g1_i1:42-1082(-)